VSLPTVRTVTETDAELPAPQDPELFAATTAAVLEARERAVAHRDAGGYLPRRSDFPTLSSFDAGQPNISRGVGTKVIEWDRLFGPKANSLVAIAYEDLPKTQELIALARGRDVLKQRWWPPVEAPGEFDEFMFQFQAAGFAHRIFDRLCHVVGEDFNNDDLLGAYVEAERGVLWEHLPVDIVVPIALLTFEDDRRSLTDSIAIERLSEHEQLARVPSGYSLAPVPYPLVGAATHSFVLASWTIENRNHWAWSLDKPDAYPLEEIEACFEALRLATGLRTGYTQIYMRAKGWAQSWVAHLPPVVSGPIVRRYPPSFDDFGWLLEPTTVTEENAAAAAEIFSELTGAPGPIRLAGRRLSDALLRDREDDTVVDLCIALEGVLGDRSPNEITHKLALRTAAVVGRVTPRVESADQVFRDVKRLYAYRSKVVHGGDPGTTRFAPRSDGPGPPIVDVAERYVRLVLRELLRTPELQDPQRIDQKLVLGAINGGEERK